MSDETSAFGILFNLDSAGRIFGENDQANKDSLSFKETA